MTELPPSVRRLMSHGGDDDDGDGDESTQTEMQTSGHVSSERENPQDGHRV